MLELLFALGLLGVVSGSIAMVGRQSQRAADEVGATSDLRNKAHRAVLRFADELKSIGASTMVPNPGASGTSNLAFQSIEDVQGANVIWSDTNRLRWELDPSEVNNGADDDGDGNVDEGQVVLVRDEGLVSEEWRILCRDVPEFMPGELANGLDDNANGLVDEPALLFRRNTNLLTVTLGLERQLDGGTRIQAINTTAILLRN
jgi:hypothetical protein